MNSGCMLLHLASRPLPLQRRDGLLAHRVGMRHPILEGVEEVVDLGLRRGLVVGAQLKDLALAPVAEILRVGRGGVCWFFQPGVCWWSCE